MLNTKDPIKFVIHGQPAARRVEVRWPTDVEWIRHQAGKRSEDRDRADVELYRSIRVSGEDLEDDALLVVDVLSSGSVVPRDRGQDYVVELEVFGVHGIPSIRTRHTLAPPRYRVLRDLRAGEALTEMLLDLRRAADMYDSIVRECTGYDGPVPILHKRAVIVELFTRIADRPLIYLEKG